MGTAETNGAGSGLWQGSAWLQGVKKGVLSVNPEEVPVIKAIFHKYTNEEKERMSSPGELRGRS